MSIRNRKRGSLELQAQARATIEPLRLAGSHEESRGEGVGLKMAHSKSWQTGMCFLLLHRFGDTIEDLSGLGSRMAVWFFVIYTFAPRGNHL